MLVVEMSGTRHLSGVFGLARAEVLLEEAQRRMHAALQSMRAGEAVRFGLGTLVAVWCFEPPHIWELRDRAELTARHLLATIAEPHPIPAGVNASPSLTWHPVYDGLAAGEIEYLGWSILLTSAAESAVTDTLAWLEGHDPLAETYDRQLALGSMATVALSSWDIPQQRHVPRSAD